MSATPLESRVLRPRDPRSKAFIADIAIHRDVMYLVGGTYHEPTILASSDAAHFHAKKTPDTPGLRSIIALPDDRLIVCGEYGALYGSKDLGDSWEKLETSTQGCLFAIERDASGDLWVTGDDGLVLRSTDQGVTWSSFDAGTKERIANVVADGETLYFLCANGELIARREETLRTVLKGKGPLTDVLRTPYGLFVSGDGGQLYRSADGETFDRLEAVGPDVDLEAMTFGDGGLFVVGSRGTVLRSDDGKKFSSVDSAVRDHLFAARASGSGLFAGGEGGAVLHVKTRDDATWADRKDTIVEKAGELDAFFRETPIDTFLGNGLPELLGGIDPGARAWEQDFEAVWGTKLPDELAAVLRAIEKGAGKVLHEWRPENGVLANPAEGENLFEQLILRDQENYLGTSFVEAMTGQLYLGTYGNGDSHLASIYGDDALSQGLDPAPGGPRTMHIFDHEEHSLAFETGKSISRFAYFAAVCGAIRTERITMPAAKAALERVRDSITPSWHYRSSIQETGAATFEGFEDERPYARIWYARGLWLVYLLRADGIIDLDNIKDMFFPGHNPPLQGEVHERWTRSSARLVPTALYCMLRCYFFDDRELETYLAIGRRHTSRLVRDCARFLDEVVAGKRKGIGKIEDLGALKAAFQKLDLDPAREEARKAEAEERARAVARARAEAKERAMSAPDPVAAAWAALEDLPLQEAIELRLRDEPGLAATFTAIDFVIGQKFVRENLVLDHEKKEELEWLGMHGDPAVVPLLVGALLRPRVERKEDEADVPLAIWRAHPSGAGELLEAFAQRGRLDVRALPALRAILGQQEKYEWRRARAVALLGMLRDVESVPALLALVEWLPTDDYGEAIKRKDLAIALPPALARIGDGRAVAPLSKMLESSDRTAKDARGWVAEALGALGAVGAWREIMRHAADSDRKQAAWLLWSAGMLGAKADDATKQAIVKELQGFEPKWSVFYLDLVRDGVLARLGAPPDGFSATLDQAFTKPGWDAETTALQEAWAIRIVGVTGASTAPVKPFLRRDDPVLREVARETLERRGERVPAVRYLHRAEIARLEKEGGVSALIAAFSDETAIYRHVAAGRLGELKAEAAREPLIRFAREILTSTPREAGAKLGRDREYPLRWALKALLEIGANADVLALLAEALVHPSRDVKDPVLRYVNALPDDPSLIEPMLRVAEEKWGWQESTASEWLDAAKAKHGHAYEEALGRLRRPS